MIEESFGLKEIYDVVLKTTSIIEINGRTFQEGEVIAAFDTILISNFNSRSTRKFARGGQGNAFLMMWEDIDGITFNFEQGEFSLTQLAILTNSKLLTATANSYPVSHHEELTTSALGNITLKYTPLATDLFIYDILTGNRITSYTVTGKVIALTTPLLNVLVRYKFLYQNQYSLLSVGKQLISGYLELEGKTKLRENQQGQYTTGILRIPKLQLMSDLVLRLGEDASPQVLSFSGMGYPVGDKREKYVCEIISLDDNIDADLL